MTALSAAVRATFADAGETFAVDAEVAVADGETLVVLGPSGSGKSLLLEAVAGHHDHAGHVRAGGTDLTAAPPEARGFGFVFQDYALFPHVSVRANVAFGQRDADRPVADGGADDRPSPRGADWSDLVPSVRRVADRPLPHPADLLGRLGVGDLADRTPRTLSGGERQRVALARALAVDPRVLLLDEPLSALDAPTRRALREDLADVLADRTAVYVTHDRTTARALADRVAVMRAGTVVQAGPPDAVFDRPADAFVARFVGANVLADGDGRVAIRPEHVVLGGDDRRAVVRRVLREDATHRVVLATEGGDRVEAFAADPPAVGSAVGVGLPDSHRTAL